MSTVDITKFFPEWVEAEMTAYLVTDNPDDPGPGEVVFREFEPTILRVISSPREPVRVSVRLQFGNESFNMALSWSGKMFNCPRMKFEVRDNVLLLSGDIMHAGHRLPGQITLTREEKNTRMDLAGGFGFIAGVSWIFQEEAPDWDELDDFEFLDEDDL